MLLFAHAPADICGRSYVQSRRCALRPLSTSAASPLSLPPIRGGVWRCAIPSPSGNIADDTEEKNKTALTKPASGTLIGRVVVEILALVVGVTLLFFVAIWKFVNVLSMYLWRVVMWLANVRRLGRWACGRAVAVGSAMTQSPGQLGVIVLSIWHNFASSIAAMCRVVFAAFASVFSSRRERHVTVRSARVINDDELVSKKELDDVQREIRRMRDLLEKTTAGRGSKDTWDHKTETEEWAAADSVAQATKNIPLNSIEKNKSRLILLRHAKSTWDRTGNIDDHERNLSPVGKKEAELVGRELTRRGWLYDAIMCSNARRTTETFDRLSATSGIERREEEGKIVITESLYYAVSGDEMAAAVDKEAPVGSLSVGTTTLVICHSPGCEELVECLTGEKPKMGTACAALLEYPSDDVERKRENAGFTVDAVQLTYGRKEWSLVDVIRPAALHE